MKRSERLKELVKESMQQLRLRISQEKLLLSDDILQIAILVGIKMAIRNSHIVDRDMEAVQDYRDDQLNRLVTELNFSVRTRKVFDRLRIITVGDIIQHSADDLLETRNFGVVSLREVREKLTKLMGLKLKGD